MANQLGSPKTPPRSYVKHMRHAIYARVSEAKQFNAFLQAEATRLSSTKAVIFAKLFKYSAAQVKAAATLGSIP